MNAEQKQFQQLLNELGAAPKPQPVEPITPEEQKLETEILAIWKQQEDCEEQIAPLLYELCKLLHAPGKKGQGFDGWLKTHHKKKSTAYRWIRRYCAKNNKIETPLPAKSPAKTKPKPTSCQVALTIEAAKQEINEFFASVAPEQRANYAHELIEFIQKMVLECQ